MRDLQGIAEINGPRRAELQAERAATVSNVRQLRTPAELQALHGKRVLARQEQRLTLDEMFNDG